MIDIFFSKASRLNEQGLSYALAVVVRNEAPSSGKTGDKAIIMGDGSIEGWIGGGCTQPVVISEARKALLDGQPRLIRIAPSTDEKTEGIVSYPMTCHSGGALDVYIEPVFPKPHLIVFGHSVVAQTLCKLARAIHYEVTVVAPEAGHQVVFDADRKLDSWDVSSLPLTPHTYFIVATQGEGDEHALTHALKNDKSNVAFVASRKKATAVFESLKGQGISGERIAKIKSPAGLDIQARQPEEIAVSILAEIIQDKRSRIPAQPAEQFITPRGTMVKEHLAIEGMSCAHCVQTVERTLEGLEGVTLNAVEIGKADMLYNPEQVSKSVIVEAIEARGFSVKEEA